MPNEQEVRVYARSDGSEPFTQWLRGLPDGKTRNRIPFGPGYRVYFGREGNAVVILLCGGDKSTQSRDIERAHDYWRDYRSRDHE